MNKRMLALTMTAAIAFSGAQAASLKQGDRRDAVLDLQHKLAELGYYDGEFTGYYGTMTTTAVRNFQKANNQTNINGNNNKNYQVTYSLY